MYTQQYIFDNLFSDILGEAELPLQSNCLWLKHINMMNDYIMHIHINEYIIMLKHLD